MRLKRRRPGAGARGAVLSTVGALTLGVGAMLSAGTAVASQPGDGQRLGGSLAVGLRPVMDGFDRPVFLTHAGDDRLFVVEQGGRIRVLRRVGGAWRIGRTLLDLTDKVSTAREQGLLGLAFDPGFASNGWFYVNYTARNDDTVIARYRRGSTGVAIAASRRVLLRVPQPNVNHNGGWMAFRGPHLFIALGDGGSGHAANAANLDTLLGKILRIDPRDPDGKGPARYTIPRGNPLVGKPGRDEIWAWGLRNPWRNSIDHETGRLWVGDVGERLYEEVNRTPRVGRARDFGWPRLEGRHHYPSGEPCTSACATLPVLEYGHEADGTWNCAVVGGYVARRPGSRLEGAYLFGDTCSGRIWAVPADVRSGPMPDPALDTALVLSSFGEDARGRLYAMDLGGTVHRVLGS